MPDLVDIICQRLEIIREMIVRIGEDEDAQRAGIHGLNLIDLRPKDNTRTANGRCFSA